MAVTVDQLIAWRDSLVQKRLAGVRTFRDANGETVTYATDAEMAAAIVAANAAIAAAQVGQPVKAIQFSTSKGLRECGPYYPFERICR